MPVIKNSNLRIISLLKLMERRGCLSFNYCPPIILKELAIMGHIYHGIPFNVSQIKNSNPVWFKSMILNQV
jgi:hypothetical protein